MPHEYYMSPNNPCPACKGSHFFGQQDGVPYREERKGVTFRVTCPNTGKMVEVEIQPDEPPPERPVTELVCSTCKKANYYVFSQTQPRGSVVDQRLRCSNEGCGYESTRRLDMASGRVLWDETTPQPER